MLRTEPITKKFKDFQAVKDLYTSAFPKVEQAPLWFVFWRAKNAYIDFTAYYDGDIFAGFTYIITHEDIHQEYMQV